MDPTNGHDVIEIASVWSGLILGVLSDIRQCFGYC